VIRRRFLAAALACLSGSTIAATASKPTVAKPQRSSAEIIAAAPTKDWRNIDPANLLVMELALGKVMIELAPRFAPKHAENIRTLARNSYFDGLAILRVQDNYVTQWGDPEADDEKPGAKPKPLAPAASHLPAEFEIPWRGLNFDKMRERDGWAPVAGWVDGFAVAADSRRNRAWLTHCYGVVGAARGNAADSSTGADLYAVIGHAPRALDRNITVVGRVVQGIEHLAALPRGAGAMGFYENPEQRLPIRRVRLAADIPETERPQLQVLRTNSPSWQALLDARRHRGGWYVHSPGRTELCTVPVPVRSVP
jgi:peptidylprolyl isomerase